MNRCAGMAENRLCSGEINLTGKLTVGEWRIYKIQIYGRVFLGQHQRSLYGPDSEENRRNPVEAHGLRLQCKIVKAFFF